LTLEKPATFMAGLDPAIQMPGPQCAAVGCWITRVKPVMTSPTSDARMALEKSP
jgi:hypothetical protein